jgi:hypothetical protein
VTSTHKSLDRQLADERARHPTPREAARAGIRFGFPIGLMGVALLLVDRLVPGELVSSFGPAAPLSWRRLVAAAAVGLATSVLIAVVLAELAAVAVRWRRRLAARVWYPDRAV